MESRPVKYPSIYAKEMEMEISNLKKILLPIGFIFLFLAACGPSEAQIEATRTQIALEIFQTQTAAATPTFTPSPTFTNTPIPPTPTFTNTPTPTPAPCSHVDLNGRYVDFRVWQNALYGFVMDVEQNGCEIIAYQYFYLKWKGPGSSSEVVELTGTIEDDKVTVCYSNPTYCIPLVIFGRGKTLANGLVGWQFDKVEE
jgi:hypothetical protein